MQNWANNLFWFETAWNDNGNHCWEEGSSNVREHDCCSGATEAAYEPPWSRESEGAGAAIGFLCGWDRKRRHHTPSCAVTQPSQNSQVVILVFRNANLLILVSFWSFLPCCAYLKLTSPSSHCFWAAPCSGISPVPPQSEGSSEGAIR